MHLFFMRLSPRQSHTHTYTHIRKEPKKEIQPWRPNSPVDEVRGLAWMESYGTIFGRYSITIGLGERGNGHSHDGSGENPGDGDEWESHGSRCRTVGGGR